MTNVLSKEQILKKKGENLIQGFFGGILKKCFVTTNKSTGCTIPIFFVLSIFSVHVKPLVNHFSDFSFLPSSHSVLMEERHPSGSYMGVIKIHNHDMKSLQKFTK